MKLKGTIIMTVLNVNTIHLHGLNDLRHFYTVFAVLLVRQHNSNSNSVRECNYSNSAILSLCSVHSYWFRSLSDYVRCGMNCFVMAV